MVTNEILEYFIAEIKDAKIKQKKEEEIDDREVLFYYDGYLEALITVPRQKGLDSIVPAGERVMAKAMKVRDVPIQATFSVTGGLQVGK